MARPTDLTPELAKTLVRIVGKGLPLSRAADFVGISYRTLCRWMKRTDGPYPAFCHSLKKAKAKAQVRMIADIRAGADNWQARAWYLERSDPKNWGRKDKLEVKKSPKDDLPEAEFREELRKYLTETESEGKEVH